MNSPKQAFESRLLRALEEAGFPARSARELLGRRLPPGGTVDGASEGVTLVAWEEDYADPKRFPLKDHRRILVVRLGARARERALTQEVVRILRMLRDQGAPEAIVVLVRPPGNFRPRSFRKRRQGRR
ncbi:MAG: hypothetical protein JO332_02835 [Planctomycetaceae bacterium]|nr:hypothetical protein [Planctomycetaceae bacterium]